MAEHADKSSATSNEDDTVGGKHGPSVDWVAVKDKMVNILAAIVRWVFLLFALVLVLHVVFTIADANEDNSIVSFVRDWADPLALAFKDLFQPDDAQLKILVNYGIAAIFWLIVSSLGATIIRRLGSLGK
ncbi:hypothetical protein [Haloechinothrix salitolerans]|uniref:YGGT family protein n=1 Tax=Haloechinothrix salitolerans TaxID=926830 RepID=A0ABW2BUP3_9PSEU